MSNADDRRADQAVQQVDALLDDILKGDETASELGRARAYRRCVRYAEDELAADHLCNLFLLRAAERLGQPPMAIPVVHNRVSLPDEARVTFYYSEDEGPVLVGNKAGLRYLGRLCLELAEAPLPGENVVLYEGFPPFVGESYGLTIYHEDEEWFAAAEEGTEDEFVAAWEAELQGRIMASEEVVAVQLTGPVPSNLSLSPQKLYRIDALEPFTEGLDVPRKPFRAEAERVRVISLTDDDGRELRLAVDLDDPDLTFYYDWHLEQMSPRPPA